MLEGFVEDEMAHIRQETRSIKEDDESHDIILRKYELFRGSFTITSMRHGVACICTTRMGEKAIFS